VEPNLKDLLSQYLSGQISAADQTILYSMLLDDRNQTEAKNILRELSENTAADESYRAADWDPVIRSILEQGAPSENDPVRRISILNKSWFRYAASILIIIGVAALTRLVLFKTKPAETTNTGQVAKINDVAPASNKAVLILSTGQQIVLDSAKNGQLAKFGNTTISKTDSGKLLYSSAGTKTSNDETSFNTLTTPRGGVYELTLPDGTKAWLNAASRIDYPTRFTGKKREVFINGEVYFEVAHDAVHPFLVSLAAKTKDQGENGHWLQIEVLGTHFNMNAYSDNKNTNPNTAPDWSPTRTTLLEGSIKITSHGETKIIKPGEQAIVGFGSEGIEINQHVDIDKVMAWRNGRIVITDVSVQQLMTEISRWYDVDIEYDGTLPNKQFYGSIRRDVPLSTVLHALEAYGVKTKVEGKKIIVQ
jgi:transmembrane sensor